MIKLLISFLLLSFLIGCKIKEIDSTSEIYSEIKSNQDGIKYVLGNTYYIEGVEYKPKENYNYNKIGLASFYGPELHKIKTINNDYNNVTELLGRHKTLPIPSIVKITNLENGLSLTLKINDRHKENSTLIQVSRKASQLLKFYKNKITKVRIEVLSDPSKQMKVVTESMTEPSFNKTINASPTENVTISDLNENITIEKKINILDGPIVIGFEKIQNKNLFLKVFDFQSYEELKKI